MNSEQLISILKQDPYTALIFRGVYPINHLPLPEMASTSSIQLQTLTLDFIGWLSLSQIALLNTLAVMEEIPPLHCIDGARRNNG